MKRSLQRAIRRTHVRFVRKPLPDRLGIYLHSLESRWFDQFAQMVESVRARGFSFVSTPSELSESRTPAAWISFDDNYVSWYHALELLDSLGVGAMFFVNTEPLRDVASPEVIRSFYRRIDQDVSTVPLSTAEVRAIAEAGHAIGAHTHRHHDLGSVSTSEAVQDLNINTSLLRSHTGQVVESLAIPFGMRRNWNPGLEPTIGDLGLRYVTYAIPGMQHCDQGPVYFHRTPWQLHRTLDENWENIEVDGQAFERLTGRSAVG